MKIKVLEWVNEDELTEDIMYNTLYSLSKIDDIFRGKDKFSTAGVRIFPKTIEVIEEG